MEKVIPKLEVISHESSSIGTLAKYLLEYDGDLSELSVSKISDELFVSIATATRLSKRIGVDGFSQLKLQLAQEQFHNQASRIVYQDEVYEQYYNDITKALTISLESIDNQVIKTVSSELTSAAKINFFAVGSSNITVRYIAQKLSRINKTVTHHADSHLQYIEAMNSNSSVVAVGVSYTGLTHEILANLQLSKSRGATTVLVTTKSGLNYDFVDYTIITPDIIERSCCKSISTRFSLVIALDLIYLNIIHSNDDYYNQLLENNLYSK